MNRVLQQALATALIALGQMSMAMALSPMDVVWSESPIMAELAMDTEQRIDFPEAIAALDVPDELKAFAKLNLSATGVLHLTLPARKQHSEVTSVFRIFATSVTGSVYIIDVSASKSASPKHLRIVDPVITGSTSDPKSRITQVPGFGGVSSPATPAPMTYVALARFALTHHIGPERLVPQGLAATPVGLAGEKLERFVRLSPNLHVTPLRQWKLGSRYVTTLHVINTGTTAHQFDARALRGHFLFAATASLVLARDAETVWAVISQTPFDVANEALVEVSQR